MSTDLRLHTMFKEIFKWETLKQYANGFALVSGQIWRTFAVSQHFRTQNHDVAPLKNQSFVWKQEIWIIYACNIRLHFKCMLSSAWQQSDGGKSIVQAQIQIPCVNMWVCVCAPMQARVLQKLGYCVKWGTVFVLMFHNSSFVCPRSIKVPFP